MDLHKLVSGLTPERDLLSKLPSELKQQVLDFVGFEDQLNIRLVSRVWSIAAFERTWSHGLVLRPNKNHAQKLIEVSRRPWLREKVHKIVFSVADVDWAIVRHLIRANPYLFDYTNCTFEAKLNNDICRMFPHPSPPPEPASLGRQETAMNSGRDADEFCEGTLLAHTLAVMPNVKEIHIKFGDYPFRDLSLASMWNELRKADGIAGPKSTIQDQALAVRSYSSILMGANAAALLFTTLRMDRMPVLCFVPPDEAYIDSPFNHLATMQNAVQHVEKLDVQCSGGYLDYTHPENHTIPHNLALFLGSMPLRSLDLKWGDSFATFTQFDPDGTQSLLHLSSPFYGLTFPHLSTLRISHMAQATHMTPVLSQFLSRHSSTLRRLHINSTERPSCWNDYHPRECRCVWKQVLCKMRDNLKLEKLELVLLTDDVLKMPDGKLILWTDPEIYDLDWNEVEGKEMSPTKQLERFVLGSEDEPWVPSMDHVHERCPLVRAENNGTYNDGDLAQWQWAWNEANDGSDDWADDWASI